MPWLTAVQVLQLCCAFINSTVFFQSWSSWNSYPLMYFGLISEKPEPLHWSMPSNNQSTAYKDVSLQAWSEAPEDRGMTSGDLEAGPHLGAAHDEQTWKYPALTSQWSGALLGRGLKFMPLITVTDHPVPLSAITANSTFQCPFSGRVTSLWVKERTMEGGWRDNPMFVISGQRNACQTDGVSWKCFLQQLLITAQLVGYK